MACATPLCRVATEAAFRRALEQTCDLVVAEVSLHAFSARAALAVQTRQGGAIPLVVLTVDVDETGLADLIRAGAVDYVLKTRLGRLTQALRLAVDRARLITRLEQKRQHMAGPSHE
jgi:DNA-binding NarL/FixJ family response regulator